MKQIEAALNAIKYTKDVYVYNIPKMYETLFPNSVKSLIESTTAVASQRDISLFGENLVSLQMFRNLPVLVNILYNWYGGKMNSNTNKPYCLLDFAAFGLKSVLLITINSPAYLDKSSNEYALAKIARAANFPVEPIITFANKIIMENNADHTLFSQFSFLVNHFQFSWVPSIVAVATTRLKVADISGEFLKFLQLDKKYIRPYANKLDNYIINDHFDILVNYTDNSIFLDKINSVSNASQATDYKHFLAQSYLFSSNVLCSLLKELQGLLVVAPFTRIAAKTVDIILTKPQILHEFLNYNVLSISLDDVNNLSKMLNVISLPITFSIYYQAFYNIIDAYNQPSIHHKPEFEQKYIDVGECVDESDLKILGCSNSSKMLELIKDAI
jgi:hypothetical protein